MTADQSRPVSRVSVVEALTQIRALCDSAPWDADIDRLADLVGDVRAILDAVSVDATPAQGIDRDALDALVRSLGMPFLGGKDIISIEGYLHVPEVVDRILALVRPVEGQIGPWSGWTDWVPSAVSPFEFRWLRGTPRTEVRPLAAGPEVS